jgi:hypothetical protein
VGSMRCRGDGLKLLCWRKERTLFTGVAWSVSVSSTWPSVAACNRACGVLSLPSSDELVLSWPNLEDLKSCFGGDEGICSEKVALGGGRAVPSRVGGAGLHGSSKLSVGIGMWRLVEAALGVWSPASDEVGDPVESLWSWSSKVPVGGEASSASSADSRVT